MRGEDGRETGPLHAGDQFPQGAADSGQTLPLSQGPGIAPRDHHDVASGGQVQPRVPFRRLRAGSMTVGIGCLPVNQSVAPRRGR